MSLHYSVVPPDAFPKYRVGPVTLAPDLNTLAIGLSAVPCAFFFDIDGTIAEIAPMPEAAFIVPEILMLLSRMERLDCPVALISGRALSVIDALSFPYRFAAGGQHGQELRLPDGRIDSVVNMQARQLIEQLSDEVIAFALNHPALLAECKNYSIAVHFRQAPELEREVKDFLRALEQRHPSSLLIQDGKMVSELRLKGADKGNAIERIASHAPFSGKRPVFIGDDRTDEQGFLAVNNLNGISIKIGQEQTHARHRMENVPRLQEWLASYVNLLSESKKA